MSQQPVRCGTCRHFDSHPAHLEAAIAGLSTMGSAFSAVRAEDGLCALHDRYLAHTRSCARHEYRAIPARPVGPPVRSSTA
jgi:hypothetical protein